MDDTGFLRLVDFLLTVNDLFSAFSLLRSDETPGLEYDGNGGINDGMSKDGRLLLSSDDMSNGVVREERMVGDYECEVSMEIYPRVLWPIVVHHCQQTPPSQSSTVWFVSTRRMDHTVNEFEFVRAGQVDVCICILQIWCVSKYIP